MWYCTIYVFELTGDKPKVHYNIIYQKKTSQICSKTEDCKVYRLHRVTCSKQRHCSLYFRWSTHNCHTYKRSYMSSMSCIIVLWVTLCSFEHAVVTMMYCSPWLCEWVNWLLSLFESLCNIGKRYGKSLNGCKRVLKVEGVRIAIYPSKLHHL